MNPRIRQLVYKLFPGRTPALWELHEKKWEIAPAERRFAPPAIYLEGDLDLITGVMEDTTLEHEMRRIQGGPINHAATIAYQLRDIQLFQGSLFKGRIRHPLQRKEDALPSSEEEHFTEVAIASTFYGSFYFGHWMSDDLTLHLAAESVSAPLTVARKPYSHEAGYRELFRIPEHGSIQARIDSLILLDDIGQNRYKQARYQELRNRLRAAVPTSKNELVYLRRGSGGASRALINEAAIEQTLMSLGFSVVDPEQFSPHQIAEQVQDARIVCAVEGSHLSHGIYNMRDGGAVMTLQPPYRFNHPLKDITDCLEMRYGFVMGIACQGGFTVDPQRLEQVLQRLG